MEYRAPVSDIKFLLHEIIGMSDIIALKQFSDFDDQTINAIIDESARFVEATLAPINKVGDAIGAKYHNYVVKMPEQFIKAYELFKQNGWGSLSTPVKFGGQGAPYINSVILGEMINGANMAFGLCPLLTSGVIELLLLHASQEQQDIYLPKLISSQWTGTMCLTESRAGSDLGALTTTAVVNGDHYLISGQKIFITYGEHNLSDNIIHMVLARVKGAPSGSKGISLFIVPKFLPNGKRNDVRALGVEHKLGIHASPTCTMSFGDNKNCIGYLVGEENHGLKYMFTMMNNARLAVASQAIGLADYAFQRAYIYAVERVIVYHTSC